MWRRRGEFDPKRMFLIGPGTEGTRQERSLVIWIIGLSEARFVPIARSELGERDRRGTKAAKEKTDAAVFARRFT